MLSMEELMRDFDPVVSICRHCQNYSLEGRRGGYCSQLGSLMQGSWTSCSLAIPPFAPSWESASGIKQELVQLFKEKQQQSQAGIVKSPIANRDPIEVLEACINTPDANDVWLSVEEMPASSKE